MAELLAGILAVVLEEADVLDARIALQVEDALGGDAEEVRDFVIAGAPPLGPVDRVVWPVRSPLCSARPGRGSADSCPIPGSSPQKAASAWPRPAAAAFPPPPSHAGKTAAARVCRDRWPPGRVARPTACAAWPAFPEARAPPLPNLRWPAAIRRACSTSRWSPGFLFRACAACRALRETETRRSSGLRAAAR